MAYSPPRTSQVLDRRGKVTPAWHRYFSGLHLGVVGSVVGEPGTGGGGGGGGTEGYWSPITNGDPLNPELLYDSNGDVVMGFVTP